MNTDLYFPEPKPFEPGPKVNFKWLAPRYIKLRPQVKEVERISTESGFEILYQTPKDTSLVNDLMRIGIVEEANPAPDINGDTCPLLPGDLVFADNCLFHEIWQEDLLKEGMGFVCMKNRIVAYERDGKIYCYPKFIHQYNKTRSDGTESPPVDTLEGIGLHRYQEGYHLVTHRKDIYDSLFGLASKFATLHEGLETNFDRTRDLKTVFEVISENNKGKLYLYPFDWAVPFRIDPADLAEKKMTSILGHSQVYGIEISEILAEVVLN